MNEHNLISICCITFNHELYVAQALDSFLLQESSFPYEIVISDDCSTDRTLEILKQYKERYPDLIRLHTNTTNIGMMPNFLKALMACKGEYIAICEGDDYWTNPFKLQKQVDFLEANQDFSVCFHRVEELRNVKDFVKDTLVQNSESERVFTKSDILKGNFIHTPSVVFRNHFDELPEWVLQMQVGDYPLHIYNASFGKIKYFPDVMAVYRLHNSSSWSSLHDFIRQRIWMILLCNIISKANLLPEDNEILYDQLSSMFTMFRKECLYNNREQIYLDNLQLLLDHPVFKNWWFDHYYKEEWNQSFHFPKGINKSIENVFLQIKSKIFN